MVERDEFAISNKLGAQFYQLTSLHAWLLREHPQLSQFIHDELVRFAENVLDLASRSGHCGSSSEQISCFENPVIQSSSRNVDEVDFQEMTIPSVESLVFTDMRGMRTDHANLNSDTHFPLSVPVGLATVLPASELTQAGLGRLDDVNMHAEITSVAIPIHHESNQAYSCSRGYRTLALVTQHPQYSSVEPRTPSRSFSAGSFYPHATTEGAQHQRFPVTTTHSAPKGAIEYHQHLAIEDTQMTEAGLQIASTKLSKRKLHVQPTLEISILNRNLWFSLKALMDSTQTPGDHQVYCDLGDISSVFHRIDEVESDATLCALRRRVLLYRFTMFQGQIAEKVDNSRRRQRGGRRTGAGKAECEVVDELMMAVFPETRPGEPPNNLHAWRKEHRLRRKQVQNRSHAARNWGLAVNRFSPGILALIPLTPTQNSRFEKLTDDAREMLFTTWRSTNGAVLQLVATKLDSLVQKLFTRDKEPDTRRLSSSGVPLQIDETVIEYLLEHVEEHLIAPHC